MTAESAPLDIASIRPTHPPSNAHPQDLAMGDNDFQKLLDDALDAIRRRQLPAAILGDGATCRRLIQFLDDAALLQHIDTVYSIGGSAINADPIQDLSEVQYETIIVAADKGKEGLIQSALPYIRGAPRLIVAGYSHYEFEDPVFHSEISQLEVESLANGYADTLPHLYQCLRNAARLNRDGVVAEFGIYRGGTTMFLARIIHRLGKDWRIYGFDTFTGFPKRRDARDMYEHHDLFDNNEASVRKYLHGENVEIIAGDIVETASVLAGKPIVLAFMDTDNYSPAKAALDVIRDNVVVGGAIVFDHFTGENRFRYTLGERMAAQALLDDPRYFNLHGTGVFIRQAVEP